MNQADVGQSSPQSTPANAQASRGPVALVYSPHAGSAQGVDPQALLEQAGIAVALAVSVETLDTDEPLGQRWRAAGCVAAVAAGGDGTVGAVASHAVGADLPLGILPLGTANDIARALSIPLTLADAAQVIAQGVLHPIDTGQVIPLRRAAHADATPDQGEQGDLAGSYFLHALTLGLNVEFARRATDVEQRRTWGKLTYVASAIESLQHLTPVAVTLRFTGLAGAPAEDVVVVQSQATLFTAINLPVFGGRLGLRVPGASVDDRLLDFIVVEAPEPQHAREAFEGALGALGRAAQALWASHGPAGAQASPVEQPAEVTLTGARLFRARAVEIETEQPVELTLDGELRGHTPALAQVAPRSVQVIVPADSAADAQPQDQ